MKYKNLLSFLNIIQLINALNITKCCPHGETLKFDYENRDEQNLSCMKSEENTEVFHENFIYVQNATFPKCNNLYVNYEHNPKSDFFFMISRRSCIDYGANGKIYVINCDQIEQIKDTDLVYLVEMRKCCPYGQAYNFYERKCLKTDSNILKPNNFAALLDYYDGYIAVFSTGPPKCNSDQVLVEYEYESHNFTLSDDKKLHLQINSKETLNYGSFCFDALWADSVKWIAKACQPLSICNRIPCVRKCCGPNEKFMGHRKGCVAHDADMRPIFHDIIQISPILDLPPVKTVNGSYQHVLIEIGNSKCLFCSKNN